MGLMEELKKAEEELAEIEKKESGELDEDLVHESDNADVEDEENQDNTEEADDAPDLTEEPEDVTPEPTEVPEEVRHNDFYKTRRENAALKKELEELRRAKQQEASTDGSGADQTDAELQEVLREVRVKKAEREFVQMEREFARNIPDYEDISHQYKMSVYQAQRVIDPRASHEELLERTRFKILEKASMYMQRGYDPIEEIYNEAKILGLTKREKEATQKEVETEKTAPKVDHTKLRQNRMRSTGMAAAKGSGGAPMITLETAAKMTPEEWQSLTTEEKNRIMYGS